MLCLSPGVPALDSVHRGHKHALYYSFRSWWLRLYVVSPCFFCFFSPPCFFCFVSLFFSSCPLRGSIDDRLFFHTTTATVFSILVNLNHLKCEEHLFPSCTRMNQVHRPLATVAEPEILHWGGQGETITHTGVAIRRYQKHLFSLLLLLLLLYLFIHCFYCHLIRLPSFISIRYIHTTLYIYNIAGGEQNLKPRSELTGITMVVINLVC